MKNGARPLTKDEFSSLFDSIKEHGLRDPIVTNDKGVVLDGHNRLRICRKLGISDIPCVTKNFNNLLEEQLYVHEVNLLRRQLTKDQRVEKVRLLKPLYEQLVKLHMSQGGKGVQIDAPLGRVNEILASKDECYTNLF